MLSLLHALQFPHCCILTCTVQFLTELYNFTWIMPNNISHNSIAWQNYFITFAIVSIYFLFKSVWNRNKTLMKNSKYSERLNMADNVNWDICFLCKDSVKAPEHEYIFSKYSWTLIKSIILMIFWRVAWNCLNNCLRNCVYIYICF